MKRPPNIVRLIFLLLVMLSFQGCKPEKDQEAPKVSIELPGDGALFSIMDPIPVKASVTDNKIIESIEISLYSTADNRKVGKSMFFYVGSSSYQLATDYVISDSLLPSGSYYLRIHAYDGNNIGYGFKQISLSGLPKRKLGIVIISSAQHSTNVFFVEEGNLKNLYSFSFPCAGAAISSQDHLLYLADRSGNTLYGLNLTASSTRWLVNFPAPSSTPIINYLSSTGSKRKAAISLQNGTVELISPEGSTDKRYYLATGQHPKKHFVSDQFVLVETSSNSGSTKELEVFYKASAGNYDKVNIGFEIVEAFFNDAGNFDLFVNQNGKSKLVEYSISGRILTERQSILNDSISNVVKISNNEFIVSSGSTLYKFKKSSGNAFQYIHGKQASDILYEPLSEELYVATQNNLHIYDYSSAIEKRSYSTAEPIIKILPLYNY